MGLYKIKFDNQIEIKISNLNDFNDSSHFFCRFSPKDTVEELFDLQIKHNFAHIIILFEPQHLETLLTHINVYDFFCYSLIPTEINREVYQKIYNFYFYSPISVSYITWIGSLLFSPKIKINKVTFDDIEISLNKCSDCFLAARNCSKIVPFSCVFHPEKLPQHEEIEKMCEILREFSVQTYHDFKERFSKADIEAFAIARKSIGIKNHFWLDPWGVYQ